MPLSWGSKTRRERKLISHHAHGGRFSDRGGSRTPRWDLNPTSRHLSCSEPFLYPARPRAAPLLNLVCHEEQWEVFRQIRWTDTWDNESHDLCCLSWNVFIMKTVYSVLLSDLRVCVCVSRPILGAAGSSVLLRTRQMYLHRVFWSGGVSTNPNTTHTSHIMMERWKKFV